MNVSLTPELEKWVQSKVESGMYTSASEVIREGLRLLKEQDALKEIRLAELRREIQQGINSGESTPLNMDDVIGRANTFKQP
ncbi:type II toxin-antitoxin system ParD family antitoxin [Nostoc sp. CENA543]|uniref:type II toxin-antitoxin system ParD family antitoxin n=1 Tax=Nostoc sp. CENA543 TaxID=1869241 RepID=UPI000CA2B7A8|nr:type II toxin-antitoxin system ParD family antitoxin [Nostoc sp. CENA543]AUS99139.1 type II toxin-antitoxin system ParD family antitoxin [Nostoc sp. CENA543]